MYDIACLKYCLVCSQSPVWNNKTNCVSVLHHQILSSSVSIAASSFIIQQQFFFILFLVPFSLFWYFLYCLRFLSCPLSLLLFTCPGDFPPFFIPPHPLSSSYFFIFFPLLPPSPHLLALLRGAVQWPYAPWVLALPPYCFYSRTGPLPCVHPQFLLGCFYNKIKLHRCPINPIGAFCFPREMISARSGKEK